MSWRFWLSDKTVGKCRPTELPTYYQRRKCSPGSYSVWTKETLLSRRFAQHSQRLLLTNSIPEAGKRILQTVHTSLLRCVSSNQHRQHINSNFCECYAKRLEININLVHMQIKSILCITNAYITAHPPLTPTKLSNFCKSKYWPR